ncbi:MAG TPA: response regulator transcription factor [Thermomicrobiales bacterium]|jgi:DNA-binding NarL/FixJ family response regulator
MMATTRILVVDDHPLFRQGLQHVLSTDPRLHLVGEAGTAEAALPLVERALPDIVLCDINLPGTDGLELARRLHRLYPQIRVIMLTLHMDEGRILDAVRAGAAAFLTKDGSGSELLAAIGRVARGEYPINDRVGEYPGVATRLLGQFRDIATVEDADPEIFSPLTPRELRVLEVAASGQANKEIGRTLGISDQTVKNHMTSVLRKLAVNDRTQAVMHALRHGWLKLDEGGDVRQ